jgi:nitrate reductase alpha subunit
MLWRSNLLGSSAKGEEYFLKHLLGTHHSVQGEEHSDSRPSDVAGTRRPPRGSWTCWSPPTSG